MIVYQININRIFETQEILIRAIYLGIIYMFTLVEAT